MTNTRPSKAWSGERIEKAVVSKELSVWIEDKAMESQFYCPSCGAENQPEPGTSEYSIECSSCGKRIKVPGFENHRGIGTAFIGERDYANDGSYMTTKWFIFAGVPIFPICSHRLQFLGSSGLQEHYIFYATTRPNWKQVLSTYAYGVFIVCWISFVGFCMFHAPSNAWIYVIGAIGITPGILLPFALRHLAKRRIKGESGSGKAAP